MDGRGRLAQSLNRAAPAAKQAERRRVLRQPSGRARAAVAYRPPGRLDRFAERRASVFQRVPLPGGGGGAAALPLSGACAGYGCGTGRHRDPVTAAFRDARDGAGNAAGFRITGIALTGNKHLNREEILARAGVTGNTSLLFFDVAGARGRLLDDPWIADATIQKLYPNRLQITLTEREPFALWQKNGRVSVIGTDGIILESFVSDRK